MIKREVACDLYLRGDFRFNKDQAMKRLTLILLTICFSGMRLLAQSDIQSVSPVMATGERTVSTGFNITAPVPLAPAGPAPGFHFPGLKEEYLKRSKRQKRTAWILLGTGVALIGTGIAVAAAHDEDAIVAGVSLVFIGGPGLITSLISIPFFIASARSKRKAEAISSSVELLQSPVALQNGIGYKTYPGLKLKIAF